MAIRALVRGGRLTVDEPTTLPDGTVVDLVADDEGDDLDEAERAELHRHLVTSLDDARAGRVRPVEVILEELHRR